MRITRIGTDEVAPLAGAWIEIGMPNGEVVAWMPSLPSRERGLKLLREGYIEEIPAVAPLAGAWIEIPSP